MSAELGLLSRGGQSTVNYGNLLTLPVAGGLLFVEPVYIERANQESSYPQLARVLVFYNDQVGFGPSLSEALDEVFGPGAGAGATPTPGGGGGGSPPVAGSPGGASPALTAATAELQSALGQVRSAQQSGDLGSLGQALSALDTAVKNFQTANGQAPAPAPAPVPVPGPGG